MKRKYTKQGDVIRLKDALGGVVGTLVWIALIILICVLMHHIKIRSLGTVTIEVGQNKHTGGLHHLAYNEVL